MSKPYCGFKKPPGGRRKGSPGECYNIGRKSGYAAGIQKGTEQQVTRSKVAKAAAKKAPIMFREMSKDMVRDMARRKGVRNYSRMTKDELVESVATARELRLYRAN